MHMTTGFGAVTVVIPTRDRPALLRRSLQSALGQRGVRVDVVVVDDGSDEPVRCGPDMPAGRLTVIRHEVSRGVSAARNAGLAAATTQYVAFLDDDDIWAPDKLQAQLTAMEDTHGAGWSCTGAVHVDARVEPFFWHSPPRSDDVLATLARHGGIPGGGSGVVVAADLSRALGGFDESFALLADWDFYYRLGSTAVCAPVDRPLVAYYVHRDSMFHDPRALLRELPRLMDKHGSAPTPVGPDRDFWLSTMIVMAVKSGDLGALLRVASSGLARGTNWFDLVSRLWAYRWGAGGPNVHRSDVPPPDWRNEDLTWLRRHAQEAH
jgi:glycosyltransferase involved in cell wall biosynthesis